MDQEFKNRIKSAMVIYRLEVELGKYINNRHSDMQNDGTANEILNRIDSSLLFNADINNIKTVENSYLLEALNLCESAARNTSDQAHFSDLREIFLSLDISSIRNAISHPNRPFPVNFWYKCAALATDPIIQKLHFSDVVHAFQNALEDKIETPPENWLSAAPIWAVPNNLPEPFEHSITGLVGREKDLQQLDKLIKSGRAPLVSVVAPGGVGKTSLVLQYLHDLCLTPRLQTSSNFDAVIFITLKQDRLTHEGIESLDAPSSIEELKESISIELTDIFGEAYPSFNAAISDLSDKNILFFIDNLETILRDTPIVFEQFSDDLPSKWRVIVTSRIPVDGSKNLPLDVLNKPGALHLARQYLFSRGQTNRDSALIDRITEGCKFNPLAIRLCIDTYISGNDISSSILKTNENVTLFSFTNLLKSLTDISQKILEAIFVLETPTRIELTESLSLDIDTVSAAIGELGRTSLVQRHEGENGEQYSLSRAIRDLLHTQPNNMLLRTKINAWIRKSKAITSELFKSQSKKGIVPIDHNFTPVDTPAKLIQICKSLESAIRRNDYSSIGSTEQNLRNLIGIYPSSVYLFRNLGRSQEALNDYGAAIISYRKAIDIDITDPAAHFSLATLLLKQEEYLEAEEKCKYLLSMQIWHDPISIKKQTWVLSTLLRSLLFQGKLNEVFELTDDWEKDQSLSEVKGISRASAYRLLVDNEFQNKLCTSERAGDVWIKAINILNKLVRDFGYSRGIVNISKKLIVDIAYDIEGERFTNCKKEHLEEIFKFVTKHQKDLNSYFDANFTKSVDIIKSASNLQEKFEFKEPDKTSNIPEFKNQGYTIVTVSHIPIVNDSFTQYVFAKDELENDYFLHVSFFEGGNWARWVFIELNVVLAIKFEQSSKGTARRKAIEIIWP